MKKVCLWKNFRVLTNNSWWNRKIVGVELSGKLSSLFYVPITSTYELNGDIIKYVSGGAYVLNIGVLGGITSGCLSAYFTINIKIFNYHKLFIFQWKICSNGSFNCRNPTALLFSIVWPWIQYVLMLFGKAVADPTNPAVAIPGTAIYANFK
nr:hypothetical protein [Entomoplasma sp. MP1]